MNTTPELMYIQQELIDNPREHHRSIADRLHVAAKVVGMVCKDLNGKTCTHGTKTKAEAEHRRRSSASKKTALAREAKRRNDSKSDAPPIYKQRNASININDDDWTIFKSMHKSAARRLGELIREDIKSNSREMES